MSFNSFNKPLFFCELLLKNKHLILRFSLPLDPVRILQALFEMSIQDTASHVDEDVTKKNKMQLLTKFINRVEAKADEDRAETKAHLDSIGASRDAPQPEMIQPLGG